MYVQEEVKEKRAEVGFWLQQKKQLQYILSLVLFIEIASDVDPRTKNRGEMENFNY